MRNILFSRTCGQFSAIRSLATETTTAVSSNPSPPAPPALVEENDKLFSKLEVELRGVDPAVLKSYSWFATTAANHLGIEVGKW